MGYDPTTKREIPRSYIYFLESRVAYLEETLTGNNVDFRPGQPYEGETKGAAAGSGAGKKGQAQTGNGRGLGVHLKVETDQDDSKRVVGAQDGDATPDSDRKLDHLVSNIGMVSFQGASDPRYLGSTSGISFARVVYAALRSSIHNGSVSDRSVRAGERRASIATATAAAAANGGASSMRESFFGLQIRPTMKCAPFPDRELAERLVDLYFEHANPQIPILHRGEFMDLFARIYSDEANRSARDMYILNIVCAIGAGIIFETKGHGDSPDSKENNSPSRSEESLPSQKRQKMAGHQHQPEEYHASAVMHLDAFLCSSSPMDGSGGGLEELQAVLLLASFALLRPVAPGLWYIIGVAVRLAIDLGLHYEDGAGIDTIDENEAVLQMARRGPQADDSASPPKLKIDVRERGRREWVRELRRRLFWCTYAFDRLVSTCVGRPFGITDEVIATEFPSLLDDKYITKSGFLTPPSNTTPTYKHVTHHYLKLRILQSEIQQVLQYQQAKISRRANEDQRESYFQRDLSSPFIQKFGSFRSWRRDIHRRLDEWKDSSPTTEQIGVRFSIEFLELNYWQTVLTLYRPSLTVPAPLADELSPRDDLSSPTVTSPEEPEDEDDVFLKVAEAGQKIPRLYRQLHCKRLVNYTYLATHHLFMAGQ